MKDTLQMSSRQIRLSRKHWRKRIADVKGIPTRVMTAEHLAAIALNTGRAKDYARLVQFFEQQAVDREKLAGIIQKHSLTAKWQKFRERYLDE